MCTVADWDLGGPGLVHESKWTARGHEQCWLVTCAAADLCLLVTINRWWMLM